MKKRILLTGMIIMLCAAVFGCGNQAETGDTAKGTTEAVDTKTKLEDGVYTANFETDSSMFHVNEADEGKGTLTVKDGQMTIHVRLVSKNIVNLYAGTAEDAQKAGAELLEPVTETVTYSDGYTEEVYAFDIPVPAMDTEFDVALIGKKGTWYDHKVKITNAEKKDEQTEVPSALGSMLTWKRSVKLHYATQFSIDYYEDHGSKNEYPLITIADDGQYLVIPTGEEKPEGIPEEIITLASPKQIYLVASQVIDMFVSIDALDQVQFSALNADSCYIKEAKEKIETGEILYAGKYSAPDYELILSEGCDLAIENTMIYHSPEVKEKLESCDIPVLVDRSSYESEPLGRTEWVKLYGALIGQEEQAEKAFEAQEQEYRQVAAELKSKDSPSVALFYISANGDVKVRKSADYLPKMIKMAGGSYIFSDLGGEEENASSTVNMQMEEFYKNAKDADYIIYNSTIEGELESLDDFLGKNELLSNIKAVKEDHVYCTSQNLYQSTMELGTIISDIHKMLTGKGSMQYLYQLQ